MALWRLLSRSVDVKIKWPNDILLDGKKLAGILCENVPGVDGLAIVGIGLNVNAGEFPEVISAATTSLKLATGKEFSVQKIWLSLCCELARTFRRAAYPLSAAFIAAYGAAAYRYVKRPEISPSPLEFLSLLPDGRAEFKSVTGNVILSTPE